MMAFPPRHAPWITVALPRTTPSAPAATPAVTAEAELPAAPALADPPPASASTAPAAPATPTVKAGLPASVAAVVALPAWPWNVPGGRGLSERWAKGRFVDRDRNARGLRCSPARLLGSPRQGPLVLRLLRAWDRFVMLRALRCGAAIPWAILADHRRSCWHWCSRPVLGSRASVEHQSSINRPPRWALSQAAPDDGSALLRGHARLIATVTYLEGSEYTAVPERWGSRHG